MKKILFLAPYPLQEAPSQRFRFEQYLQILEEKGFHYHFQSFLSPKGWQVLYQPGKPVLKVFHVLWGFLRRKRMLLYLYKFDYVFVHREAAPLGPPIFEWIIAKIFRKKIIYDFDDAIWMADEGDLEGILLKLKWHGKVASICKWSYKVSCGNEFLREYALRFNPDAFYNPTTIDTEHVHNQTKIHTDKKNLSIGWTGTHSTLRFLEPLWPVLKQLEDQYDNRFVLIANREPKHPLKNLSFVPWSKSSEINDLLLIDIGIMPLEEDVWSEGKCGFKALQYMALGIPAVASPVGVNTRIIQHGQNGYLCNKPEEWFECLSRLMEDLTLRAELGGRGKECVDESYSVRSNSSNFLALFS